MRGRRGFTLIEVLVVVVVIAIVSLIAFPSYRRARLTQQNEMARVKLMEVANAARMFNEDNRAADRVAGGFGAAGGTDAALAGFRSPRLLFVTAGNIDNSGYSYLRSAEWNTFPAGCTTDAAAGTCLFHYRGYTFFICNPDGAAPQPAGCAADRFAIMLGPAAQFDTAAIRAEAVAEYSGSTWWVSRDNLGIIGSDYGQ